MRQLAEGVHQLRGFPPDAINAYLVGDVLVDAASRHGERRILRELDGRALAAHVVTHAHPDHQGSSHAICTRLRVPLWCGEADVEAIESGRLAERQPPHPLNRLSEWAFAGPGHPVARGLREGDGVADFTVLETPGHSAGHIALWRARDRTLIVGDVLFGCHPLTGVPGLHEPPVFFTPDPAQNRGSARRLAALEPALVLFGHGPPLRDRGALRAFVARLAG